MSSLIESLQYKPVELSFGTSGLRGLVLDMTDLECYINARAFLNFLQLSDDNINSDIYLAGDLRDSTPRILKSINRAIIPTPALAYYALQKHAACIMVTGSHIPADRNGIKFYKYTGEVIKEDESAIKNAVLEVRKAIYSQDNKTSLFNSEGMFRIDSAPLPKEITEAGNTYLGRFIQAFSSDVLVNRQIIFYQHSAVGRDMLVGLLQDLGASVIAVGRSDKFIPIDSENVTDNDQAYFHSLAVKYPDAFAIVSTDGDSDRPFLVDEKGIFHRGDVLGAVVAEWLKADFAAFPVSSSDAVNIYLDSKSLPWKNTKIGSPYIIAAMNEAKKSGRQRVVSWEVNGGFMTASDLELGNNHKLLRALPTRDAILPIIAAMLSASQKNITISALFDNLPPRYTQAGLIDNFPTEVSQKILQKFSADNYESRIELAKYFSNDLGFRDIDSLNTLDGIRIFFKNSDIAHIRPSGNAPQLRIYSVASNQKRADDIVKLALKEPNGILRSIQAALS
jgi:phosphomannomutase